MTNRNVITKNKWMKIYDDMEELYETCKPRKLTLFGKSNIINTITIKIYQNLYT